MKDILLILTLLISINLYSDGIDTLKINSQIKDVTIFFDGAQITRQGQIRVSKGKHLIVLDRLPAEINPKSIQVESNQKVKILSVKHELTYPDANNKILLGYEKEIEKQEILIQEISNKISVYDIEEKILLDNSVLNSKNDGATIAEIKEASIFYRAKLNEIKHERLKLVIEINLVKDNIQAIYLELNEKISNENKTYSKISFTIESDAVINSSFMVSYYISSAGWSPLYDFRVKDVEEPLNLVYNASIYQSTGEDWNNVNITLSSNKPSLSNLKPELAPWFINRRNSYQKNNIIEGQSTLKGGVIDRETGEPLAFANVIVSQNGEMIAGSTTDFDGRYTIKPIASGYYDIGLTYIGYQPKVIKGVVLHAGKITFLDFKLTSSLELQNFEVVEYEIPLIDKDGGASGVKIRRREIQNMPGLRDSLKEQKSGEVEYFVDGYESSTNVTNLEYKIDIPYSIASDGKDNIVKIKEVIIPVEYVYYSTPKLDKDVFLVAEINNWNELKLLTGQSSIYYKGTFTGQSSINASSLKDTLSISLSRDENIIVERTLLKEKDEKQFVGKNIKETISWSITIKNNKTVKAIIFVEDQFPISENKSVEIDYLEFSKGIINDKTGKVLWELELEPNETKELVLKYSVKYPDHMHLFLE